jgi:hypothetical protein
MSDAVGGELPAEVQATFGDADLRARLASDDYVVREAAQARLSEVYQRAYGDVAPEAVAPAMGMPSGSISEEMTRSPGLGALEVDADEIPPAAQHYISPQIFRSDPQLVDLFQGWAARTELTQAESTAVASAVDVYCREGSNIGEWPQHLADARLRLLEDGFNATAESRATLARARGVFADMRRTSPDLCELLVASGAASDPDVVRALARLARW